MNTVQQHYIGLEILTTTLQYWPVGTLPGDIGEVLLLFFIINIIVISSSIIRSDSTGEL
jgi:hypothetical protein